MNQVIPKIIPGTALHTFIWQPWTALPTRESFNQGHYWVRGKGRIAWVRFYDTHQSMEMDVNGHRLDFCGPIPEPQAVVDGRATALPVRGKVS